MSYVFKQICNGCNTEFDVEYKKDGSYAYVGEPCECEDGFSPANSNTPSISQWLENQPESNMTSAERADRDGRLLM